MRICDKQALDITKEIVVAKMQNSTAASNAATGKNIGDMFTEILELDVTTCGNITGTYHYPNLHFDKSSKKFVDTDIITLENVSSDILNKLYPNPELLKKRLVSFMPEQINDIAIHF